MKFIPVYCFLLFSCICLFILNKLPVVQGLSFTETFLLYVVENIILILSFLYIYYTVIDNVVKTLKAKAIQHGSSIDLESGVITLAWDNVPSDIRV